MGEFLVFYVTNPDEMTARNLSKTLLEARLIACANVFAINSHYRWEGALAEEGEWVAILKTSIKLELRLEAALQELHPYQTPCFMRFNVRANEAYARWIEASVETGSSIQ